MSLEAEQIREGYVLAGKYQVERLIGQGGMGVVLAARHVHLGERVAIKLMRRDSTEQAGAVTRFVREARALARLESIHVARVSDVGVLDDQRPFMVMEYLEGTDLEALLARSGPLGIETTVDYVLQAAQAIAEAHSLNIVHRDLKPSNLFLTQRRDGVPLIKVLDFGISKVTDASVTSVTVTSSLMGSPAYMSPEQMTATAEVDARTDIWSLGVIMYELLSGLQPFRGDTLPQVCARVLQRQPEALRALRPEVSPELEAVVMRCLAKSPSDRYANILEFALALGRVGGQSGRASIERIVRLSGGDPHAALSTPPTTEARRRFPFVVAIGLAAAALVIGGAALWLPRAPATQKVSAEPQVSVVPTPVTGHRAEPPVVAIEPPGPTVPMPATSPTPRRATVPMAPLRRAAPVVSAPPPARSVEIRTKGFGGRL